VAEVGTKPENLFYIEAIILISLRQSGHTSGSTS
jgi:hypothetical protein